MTDEAASQPGFFDDPRRVLTTQALVVLGLVTVVYLPILEAMVRHWRMVPDYSHGFLIVPLSLYFAYEKKYVLEAAPVRGNWWGLAEHRFPNSNTHF